MEAMMIELLVVLALLNPTPLDVMALLRNVEETYAAMKTYHFEGCDVAETPVGGGETITRGCFRSVGVRPGRGRDELTDEYGQVVSVSDGRTTWTYDSNLHQYTVVKGSLTDSARPSASATLHGGRLFGTNAQGSLVSRFEKPTLRIESGRWLRSEIFRLGGKAVVCDVVSVEYKPDPSGKVRWSDGMLWISRDPGVVVKEVKTISGARGEHGARVTTTLTTAQVNVPISDDEFRFVAPAGAKEVPTLGGR